MGPAYQPRTSKDVYGRPTPKEKPRYQQRHYEGVAGTLCKVRRDALVNVSPDTEHLWEHLVDEFCHLFAADNEYFKTDTFRKACNK